MCDRSQEHVKMQCTIWTIWVQNGAPNAHILKERHAGDVAQNSVTASAQQLMLVLASYSGKLCMWSFLQFLSSKFEIRH